MEAIDLHAAFVPRSPKNLSLAANELHLWVVPLSGEHDGAADVLSLAERERAARFRFADHQKRFAISHNALRRILAGYLGQPPQALEFGSAARGKPYLVPASVQFNLSHSGRLALIGVAQSELGVDLEKVRHFASMDEIAKRHFAPAEYTALSAFSGESKELAFYRCWTRKEAYIKALGEGLSLSLDSFEVSLGEVPQLLACRGAKDQASAWSMVDASPGQEFVAAAVVRGSIAKVQRFSLLD